jgi:hypothetical protein
MTTLLEPPTFTEQMRGSSAGRHPWFLLSTGGPPNLPPDTIVTGGRGEEPPDDDQCPACRYAKVGLCKCGYDWDNWRWVSMPAEASHR